MASQHSLQRPVSLHGVHVGHPQRCGMANARHGQSPRRELYGHGLARMPFELRQHLRSGSAPNGFRHWDRKCSGSP